MTSSRTDLSRIGEGIEVVREAAEAGRTRPGGAPDHLPGRGPLGRAGAGPRAGPAAAVGQLRRHPRRHRWLAEQGVTEIFYDLNWDPLVGSPDADPAGAAARATEILDGLAPDAWPGRSPAR